MTTMTNDQHSERTKGELIRRASKLFGSKGYFETSIEDILRETGLTKGALYHHFKDKKDLFRQVFIDARTQMEAVASAANPHGVDALDKLFADFETLAEFVRQKKLLQIIVVDPPSVFSPREWFKLNERYFVEPARLHLNELVKQRRLKSSDVDLLSIILVGATNEAMRRYWALGKETDLREIVNGMRVIFSPFLTPK
jgi:AcrR family transcriptional regulator